MVGFLLSNTLSDHGWVSRGVCRTSADDMLEDIEEITQIEKDGAGVRCDERALRGDEIVSMNFWGFQPSFIEA